MSVVERQLRYFKTESGKVPFKEWFEGLKDKKTRAVIDARLTRLEVGSLGKYRDLGDGVKELKINFGPGFRVYFAESSDVIVLLLCGGDKGSQERDIEKAKKFWKEYKDRKDV